MLSEACIDSILVMKCLLPVVHDALLAKDRLHHLSVRDCSAF
jgi:hypothetical protein